MTRSKLFLATALFAAMSAALAGHNPAMAQKAKDTLRYPLSDAESALDPYLLPGPFNNGWELSVWDSLLSFDSKNVKLAPLIAKSWAQVDSTTYEYELRDDVKFHDGETLDADDVVYTIKYITDPKVNLRYKSNWNWIASVEKLNQFKVRIKAKRPVPDGMMWMAYTSIFPEHIHGPLTDKQAFGAKPVGSGPLKIVKLDKNTGIIAEKNPDFKAIGAKVAAGVGRVVSEPVPDAGTLVAKILTGEVDLARDVPADAVTSLKDSGQFEFTLAPETLAYTFIGFPSAGAQNVKALGDVRVRQAIIKAINRQDLVEAQYGAISKGNVKPHEGLCSKEQLGCGFSKAVPDYDPAGAKKLLAEAGYADGFDVVISTFPTNQTEATALSGMLRAVGIRARVRVHLPAARVQMLAQGKVDIGYYGWSGGGMFDVSPQLVRHFLSKEYDDPEITKMASAAMGITDDAERRKAVTDIMDMAHDKAYAFPMVPIRAVYVHTSDVTLKNRDIRAGTINAHEFSWK